MTAFACADINREALQHNLSVVRMLAPNSKVMAVIKANAYGHGIEQVARALDTVVALAVARISEAMDVRYAGIDKPVVLLEGVMRTVATSDVYSECTFANSAGILNYPSSHADWVRPGAMLYGLSPIQGKTGADPGLKPVMTL